MKQALLVICFSLAVGCLLAESPEAEAFMEIIEDFEHLANMSGLVDDSEEAADILVRFEIMLHNLRIRGEKLEAVEPDWWGFNDDDLSERIGNY